MTEFARILPAASGYGESNYRIADWVGGELPIRNVAAKCIHNELLPADDISYRCGLRAAPIGYACTIKGEQHFSCCGIYSVELAIALAEKYQVTCDQHSGLCGLCDLNLPDNLSCSGIRGAKNAEIGYARNNFSKGRTQEEPSGIGSDICWKRVVHGWFVTRAVIDKLGTRTESCRDPFASTVIAHRNQHGVVLRNGILRSQGDVFRQFCLVNRAGHKVQRRKRLDRRCRLGRPCVLPHRT